MARYKSRLDEFREGQRVQAHPATVPYMQGDRYGNVTKVGRKWIHVNMDRSGRVLRFAPHNLIPVSVD